MLSKNSENLRDHIKYVAVYLKHFRIFLITRLQFRTAVAVIDSFHTSTHLIIFILTFKIETHRFGTHTLSVNTLCHLFGVNKLESGYVIFDSIRQKTTHQKESRNYSAFFGSILLSKI